MKPREALYCENCSEIFELAGHRNCPACGSESVLPLERVMKTEAEPWNPLPPPRWPEEVLLALKWGRP